MIPFAKCLRKLDTNLEMQLHKLLQLATVYAIMRCLPTLVSHIIKKTSEVLKMSHRFFKSIITNLASRFLLNNLNSKKT